MEKTKQMLADALVFRKLNDEQLTAVCKMAVARNLEKGQIISLYGDNFPYVLLVETGSMQIVKESDKGGSIVTRTYRPGDIFWGHAVVDNGPTPGSVQAYESNTNICLWHKDYLLPVLKQNVEAVFEISTVIMNRLRFASKKIEQLAFNNVMTRLARLILEEYYKSNEQLRIPRSLTLEEMAKRVGTNRDVVCRLLYRISDEDIIEINRQYFTIKDLSSLEKIAKG